MPLRANSWRNTATPTSGGRPTGRLKRSSTAISPKAKATCACAKGVFYYDFGKDIEPTYATIEDGSWRDEGPYGVVHRVASDGSVRGVGSACLNWAFNQCGHLRIDTHGDNGVMQRLLEKLGFEHRGTVFVEEDDYPRLAFEKTR